MHLGLPWCLELCFQQISTATAATISILLRPHTPDTSLTPHYPSSDFHRSHFIYDCCGHIHWCGRIPPASHIILAHRFEHAKMKELLSSNWCPVSLRREHDAPRSSLMPHTIHPTNLCRRCYIYDRWDRIYWAPRCTHVSCHLSNRFQACKDGGIVTSNWCPTTSRRRERRDPRSSPTPHTEDVGRQHH